MALDDITSLDGAEGASEGGEVSFEVSEQYKEQSRRSQAGIKRTQKDESKAKKYDIFLAGFLVKIIVDKRYDFVLSNLFKAMDSGYPSNFILGILSLINIDISKKIREVSKKPSIKFDYKANEIISFDDSNLPGNVKDRINLWIEDIIDSVSVEYSNIQTEHIINSLEKDDSIIIDYISMVFRFFLQEINIVATEGQAKSIANFIVSEVGKALKSLKIETI